MKYNYVCIHIGYVDRAMTHVVDICHSIGIVTCAYTNLIRNIKCGYGRAVIAFRLLMCHVIMCLKMSRQPTCVE